jgi:K+/H+ antiporter YhaU regulatory subunit KhtT
MGDVLALLACAVLVMAGGVAVALIARSGRRGNAEVRRNAPRRLREQIRLADERIRQIDNALSEEDLDSLEQQRNEEI